MKFPGCAGTEIKVNSAPGAQRELAQHNEVIIPICI